MTKSSIIVGMGETFDEVVETMIDLRGVGVDIVTIGQYLRPTSTTCRSRGGGPPPSLPSWKRSGEQELGIAHVEASPLTRSSHHAAQAAHAARTARAADISPTPTGR